MAYRRILLKLSGEALAGDRPFGLEPGFVSRLGRDIMAVAALGIEVAIVVGGGNFVRGATLAEGGSDRVTGDHMGMLATVMNALAVREAVLAAGGRARVLSAIAMPAIADSFSQRAAMQSLAAGEVVIFAGGTGNPFFTTDTAAVLRGTEIGADIVMKATNVDGVYTADPKKDPSAQRFDTLSQSEALQRGLKVMDSAAIAVARENKLPIYVFSMHEPGALVTAARGEGRGTLVTGE
ncbi:MAG: UMP kinase [Hyphomicrobiaceae bacterium]|nr:UMP kinase [Hyphomicrobiaceae bacterium]